MTYKVLTQHPDPCRGSGPYRNSFIIGVEVEASTPHEAATKRFSMQTPSSQFNTSALFVCADSLAWVFPVETTPHVGSVAVSV